MCAWHKERFHTEFQAIRSHFDKEAPYFMDAKQTGTSHLSLKTTRYLGKPCIRQGSIISKKLLKMSL